MILCADGIMTTHNATNIAEDVVYLVEGEIIRHRSERLPEGK